MIVYIMPKARKSEPSAVSKTAPAQTPSVEAASVTPKVAKSVSKSAPKKKPSSVESKSNVSVSPSKVEDSNVVVSEPADMETQLTDSFNEFMAKLQTLASQMGSLKAEFRILEKKATREIKAAAKINAKRKRKTSNRSPSGFVKPTLISDELANFLKKPLGSEMARTEVTREINC